ncbi:ACP S-malonyltransferase [Desulfovibrio litoralis]|uniref:Malonyl CoA-acyl carrier protein transacylase n=1 Tax=Desulfovibrio litoralis DSM 11393 TaxID=1121455 RepID=A0A1M7SAG6_9BACT|nr:ACP S-malonyltransferase [Desulfovibrio litoralis]SHN55418.1 [Acyl-carrier-protein] S-malonyltransferase [Desulfovibrio litoralis DSM 11393]
MTKTALIFAGQGSQEPNMGRELAEKSTEIMNLWKEAEKISGIELRNIYWDANAEEQAKTQNLQPALTVVTLGLWLYGSSKLKPCCTAGHSLGEYSALVACGALNSQQVLQLVSLRGKLMTEADPSGKGAMAAIVKLPQAEVENLVEQAKTQSGKFIHIANYNTPMQYVVSGEKEAVEAIGELAKAAKGRSIPLAVSGAFHSPLMQEASNELNKAIDKLSFNNAKIPLWSNVLAQALTDHDQIKSALKMQMTGPVRWIDIIQNQWQSGVTQWLEFAPKAVLSKMTSQILDAKNLENTSYTSCSVGSSESLDAYLKTNQ